MSGRNRLRNASPISDDASPGGVIAGPSGAAKKPRRLLRSETPPRAESSEDEAATYTVQTIDGIRYDPKAGDRKRMAIVHWAEGEPSNTYEPVTHMLSERNAVAGVIAEKLRKVRKVRISDFNTRKVTFEPGSDRITIVYSPKKMQLRAVQPP